jgi:DNA-directed RNA polymerase subunit M/transcription elongation factor TFIIS
MMDIKLPEKCPECKSTEIYFINLYKEILRSATYLDPEESEIIGADMKCQECGNIWHVGEYEKNLFKNRVFFFLFICLF